MILDTIFLAVLTNTSVMEITNRSPIELDSQIQNRNTKAPFIIGEMKWNIQGAHMVMFGLKDTIFVWLLCVTERREGTEKSDSKVVPCATHWVIIDSWTHCTVY